MYEEFYGLTLKPFSKTPDPGFLYLSKSHDEALARLQYAVEEREIVLLTGDIGCGKTTLTRALSDSLDESHMVITILNPNLSPSQLLRLLAMRMGIEADAKNRERVIEGIHERLFKYYEEGITPILIIDEAQIIPDKRTFEEIRLITNFQLDDANLLCLILSGQTDLKKRIERKPYEPLRQRIGIYCHLSPLQEHDIGKYISHRVSVAGRDDELFTPEALKAIYKYSGGVPRLINSIANSALLEGFGMDIRLIDASCVEAAASELNLKGYGYN